MLVWCEIVVGLVSIGVSFEVTIKLMQGWIQIQKYGVGVGPIWGQTEKTEIYSATLSQLAWAVALDARDKMQ